MQLTLFIKNKFYHGGMVEFSNLTVLLMQVNFNFSRDSRENYKKLNNNKFQIHLFKVVVIFKNKIIWRNKLLSSL